MVTIIRFNETNTLLLFCTLTISVQAFIDLSIIIENVDERTSQINMVNALKVKVLKTEDLFFIILDIFVMLRNVESKQFG